MTSNVKMCIKCKVRPVAGPRSSYCSIACRRAAEYELRRVDRRLAELEQELSNLRAGGSIIATWAAYRMPTLVAEIELQEERLRLLLAAATEES